MVCGGSIPSIPTTASYQRHGCGVFRKIASSKATTGTNERNSQRNEGGGSLLAEALNIDTHVRYDSKRFRFYVGSNPTDVAKI